MLKYTKTGKQPGDYTNEFKAAVTTAYLRPAQAQFIHKPSMKERRWA